jgi:hypothetical protein
MVTWLKGLLSVWFTKSQLIALNFYQVIHYVSLSLCLLKIRAMRLYGGGGGIALRILLPFP